jgi:hypothetical protein
LAKRLSSEHLLLLLYRCGIGQRSDLFREDTTRSTRWGEDHRLVASLSIERARSMLTEFERAGGGEETP